MPALCCEKDFLPLALKPAVIFLLPVPNSFQTFGFIADVLLSLLLQLLVWKSLSWLSFSFAESSWALPPEGLHDPVRQPEPGLQLASSLAVQSHILKNITDCSTQQIVSK